ncbi:MAG: SIS domain-containing protein [Thermaerobacter sp.]|nr:SIS domain-containing protein [Thermaerobacter sp.]
MEVESKIWQNWIGRFPALASSQDRVGQAFNLLCDTFSSGNRLYVCGNGGSAADSEHIAGDLVKAFLKPRPLRDFEVGRLRAQPETDLAEYLAKRLERGLPVYPLVSQTALGTAIANDVAGDMVFAQQIWAYGRDGDLLWAVSTSGESRNVQLAATAAHARGMKVLGMTGKTGGSLGALCDVLLTVPEQRVDYIQTLHVAVYHILCEAVEDHFFAADAHRAR